jgi:hypothetical protein
VVGALEWLSDLYYRQGDIDTAKSLALRGLEIERRIGNDVLVAYREALYSRLFEPPEEALRALRHARELGLPESFVFRDEFRGLNEVPGFLDLLEPETRDSFALRETMTRLNWLKQVLKALHIDLQRYPDANSIEQLKAIVEPVYIRIAPVNDGWARPFIVDSTASIYTICSGGRNGGDCTMVGDGGPSTNPDDPIILRNGKFVQWPEGMGPEGN